MSRTELLELVHRWMQLWQGCDLAKGFRPFCVVATAGTINTGTSDLERLIARVTDLGHDLA